MNVLSRVFPNVTNRWTFQDHLLSKYIIWTPISSISWKTWAMNVQKASPVLLMNNLFKTTKAVVLIWSSVSWRIAQNCVFQRSEQWIYRSKVSPVSLSKTLFKTFLPLKVWYQLSVFLWEWFKALSLRIMAQSSVSQDTWTVNVHSQGLWPFQDHLLSNLIILTWWTLSPRRPE